MKELEHLREKIDAVDQKIFEQISERVKIARQIAAVKKEKALPIFDPKREEEIRERLVRIAERSGIDAAFAKIFVVLILEYSKKEMELCM